MESRSVAGEHLDAAPQAAFGAQFAVSFAVPLNRSR
jgi:hypothetical protein